jgi:hypothetical protein
MDATGAKTAEAKTVVTTPVRTAPAATGSRGTSRRWAVAGLAVALVGVAVLAFTQVIGSAREPSSAPPASPVPTSAAPSSPSATRPAPAPEPLGAAPPAASVEVSPSSVEAYTATGSPDNPGRIPRAVDNDPGSGWSTDRYFQQLPQFAPGVGLIATFGRPVRLTSVDITSPSAGTVVQVRSAPDAETPLSGTGLLATATLNAGATTIQIPPGPPSTGVLIWITRLTSADGGYQSTINEITYHAAAD